MAYVKIKFIKNVHQLENYLKKNLDKNVIESSYAICNDGSEDKNPIAQEFLEIQRIFKNETVNKAIHVIQSFSPEDSKKFNPEKLHEIGRELIEKNFKGHQFYISTHVNKKHIHNHIMINPVSFENGKRIQNSKKHLYNLRSVSNDICKANGLSIISNDVAKKFSGPSYKIDLKQKADMARGLATNFDEYVSYMSEAFDIKIRIEKKNITYFYPGKHKGNRGKKLGEEYDKSGLIKQFKTNDEKFRRDNQLRDIMRIEISNKKLQRRGNERDTNSILLQSGELKRYDTKDYGQATHTKRRDSKYTHPSDIALDSTIIPLSDIRKAKKTSIIDYCKSNKIEYETDKDGNKFLSKRKHIQIKNNEWTNTKNKIRGNIIDFVAIHKDVNYIEALSIINNDKRLMLLSDKANLEKQYYSPFKFPKEKRAKKSEAQMILQQLLKSKGVNPKYYNALLKDKHAQVNNKGVVRLFSVNDNDGAFEYFLDQNRKMNQRNVGNNTSLFINKPTKGDKAYIFTNPFTLISKRGNDLLNIKNDKGIAGMFDLNIEAMDLYINQNKNVSELLLVSSKEGGHAQKEIDFFNILKKRYKGLEIKLELISFEKAFKDRDFELSL